MRNQDREHAGACRQDCPTGARRHRWIRGIGAALVTLAFLLPSSPAVAMPTAPPEAVEQHSLSQLDRAVQVGDAKLELAQRREGHRPAPPPRGSSAELHGGTSADRYGGSSADRRGVAGRYDTRNRSVRQFTGNNRKRDEERPKRNDEMQDQDEDPPRDRFSFTPPDPSAARDRGDRD